MSRGRVVDRPRRRDRAERCARPRQHRRRSAARAGSGLRRSSGGHPGPDPEVGDGARGQPVAHPTRDLAAGRARRPVRPRLASADRRRDDRPSGRLETARAAAHRGPRPHRPRRAPDRGCRARRPGVRRDRLRVPARRRRGPDGDRHGQARRPRAQLLERRRPDVRRRRTCRRARGPGPPRHGPDPALLPRRRQPAARGTGRAAGPHHRELRGLLGPVGRAVGVPGPAQGASRRRATARWPPGSTTTAQRWLWSHPFSADDLRSVRADEAARRGARLPARPRRTGDQARAGRHPRHRVHGAAAAAGPRPCPTLACARRNTLVALDEMARAGYVDPDDAAQLVDAHRFLRTVEHRLQLVDDQQVHTVPDDPVAVDHLARVLGYRDTPAGDAAEGLWGDLRRHQLAVRAIHERIYFRPLLEAFASTSGALSPEAAADRPRRVRLHRCPRTQAAVRELTRGLNRTSRLMQQLLPLMLDWLSTSPDPDLGLLQLRNLLSAKPRQATLVEAFRESPEAARRLCLILGTSRLLGDTLARNPDLVARLPERRPPGHPTAGRAGGQPPAAPRAGGTSRPTARRPCVGGTSATGSASPPATCSSWPTSRRSGATWPRSARPCSRSRWPRSSRRCRSRCWPWAASAAPS